MLLKFFLPGGNGIDSRILIIGNIALPMGHRGYSIDIGLDQIQIQLHQIVCEEQHGSQRIRQLTKEFAELTFPAADIRMIPRTTGFRTQS